MQTDNQDPNVSKDDHSFDRTSSARCKSVVMVCVLPLLLSLCLLATSVAAEKAIVSPAASKHDSPRAPLVAGKDTLSLHTPFADGDCSLCHEQADPKAPGPLHKAANEICLECHEDFAAISTRKFSHGPASESCVICHNPHNARHPKLLVDDVSTLCLSCHTEMKAVTTAAEVKHDATVNDKACINCHNSHGADVEHLLVSLPFDLCVTCHGEDGVNDHDGRPLTNFKKLLEDNPEHHGPVADKDCSACHNPHGAKYFRLLSWEYPSRFYAPYDPKVYALCFACHEAGAFETPQTDTLTLFRDGDKNLHYLHVNKTKRGRTCRACHEVHASRQSHQIRDGVPFGSKGWILKINFTETSSGGTCTKTCHATRSYNNGVTRPTAAPQAGR